MSYTNADLVRSHISFDESATGLRLDHPVVFSDQEWINLPGRKLVENSIVVKAIKHYSPVFEDVMVVNGTVTLSNEHLTSNSVTVASNSSLGTIYRENIDYSVDSANGIIKSIDGGAIPFDGRVAVWYYHYSIYIEGSDYSIDYTAGMIRRLGGGNIQAGQTVLVDYELSMSRIDDELINEAVSEANAIVEKQVDPHRQFGADAALQAAATYFAVSLVCRMAAAGDLITAANGHQAASAWLVIAESYRSDYDSFLKSFRVQAGRLSRPVHS